MTVISEALGAVQRLGGEAMFELISGDERLAPSELASAADPGLFGPASIVWRIHSDPSVYVGGLRSLLLQSLHPLAMAGVDQHSDYRTDPWGRLNRTGRFVAATTFGSTGTAEHMVDVVKRVHATVNGVDPHGRPYSASDPHLLRWVHVAQVDSFLEAFARHGNGRLTDAERDSYVADMAVVAEMLGATHVPKSVAQLDACLRSYRAELESTPAARRAVRFLAVPPDLPLVGRAPYLLLFASATASLPGYARRMLRLVMPPLSDTFMVRPSTSVVTWGLGWLMAGTERDDSLSERMVA